MYYVLSFCFFKIIMGTKVIFDAAFILSSPLNVRFTQCPSIKISFYYSNVQYYLFNKFFFAWCIKLAKSLTPVKRQTKFADLNEELLLKSKSLKSYFFHLRIQKQHRHLNSYLDSNSIMTILKKRKLLNLINVFAIQ